MKNESAKPFVIGICGGSGSGKTTFINQLRAAFADHELAVMSQDDYYWPREKQETDENGIHNFDRPKSIDKKRMLTDLQRLLAGEAVVLKEYAFNNEFSEPKIKVIQPAPVVVVEGLFVFHFKKIAPLFDLKLYIHAKDLHKFARRILRDQKERNYPVEDVLYRYQAHVMPSFEKYIAPYRETADMVINNNSRFDESLEVIVGFVRNKLRTATAQQGEEG